MAAGTLQWWSLRTPSAGGSRQELLCKRGRENQVIFMLIVAIHLMQTFFIRTVQTLEMKKKMEMKQMAKTGNNENKTGLSWAKLSSNWNWTLLYFTNFLLIVVWLEFVG